MQVKNAQGGVYRHPPGLISPAGSTVDLDFAQLEGIEGQIALAERAVVLSVLFEPVVRLLWRL